MMNRIFVDGKIIPNEIGWHNTNDEIEYIKFSHFYRTITLNNCDGNDQPWIRAEDIPKLMKALLKAKELGWWGDDE